MSFFALSLKSFTPQLNPERRFLEKHFPENPISRVVPFPDSRKATPKAECYRESNLYSSYSTILTRVCNGLEDT